MVGRSSQNEEDDDLLTPSELGRKLVTALRSISDPNVTMQAISDRNAMSTKAEINALIQSVETGLSTRLEAVNEAIKLWHDDLVRVPTEVQKAVQSLREFLEQETQTLEASLNGKINTLSERVVADKEILFASVKRLEDVSEQRFARIDAGLMERDKRADQLALANSAALAAALSAQKEAAAEAQKSAALAIGKSEGATSEAIKLGQTLFQTGLNSLTAQVNDLKSRLDKGEGSRTISDPATETRLAALNATVTSLTSSNDQGSGRREQGADTRAMVFALIGAVFGSGIIGAIFTFMERAHG